MTKVSMTRLLSLLLLLAGCRGSATTPPAPLHPTLQAGDGDTSAFSEDLLERYVAAEVRILERSKTFTEETLAQLEKTGAGRKANAAAERATQAERRKAFDADVARFREASHIDAATWAELDQLFDSVLLGRMAWRQSGGDEAIARLEHEIAAQLEKVPEQQRPQSAAQLNHLLDGPRGLRDGAEARKRWGDAAVDRVLAHSAEVEKLRQELFQLSLQPPPKR